jgi:hypothetical protein
MFVVLVPAFLAIAFDIDIFFGSILMAPFLYFAIEKPAKGVKRISPPSHKGKLDYIRKQDKPTFRGGLRDLSGIIFMIFAAVSYPAILVTAIILFLICLDSIIMYLIDKLAG